MSESFNEKYKVRWADLDSNAHMRHTAYMDMCATARFSFLSSFGFNEKEFMTLNIGPVLFNENISYLKEVRAGETIVVEVNVSGLSEDGRKWIIHHDLFRQSDGEKVATLKASGAWLDLNARKITRPPEKLFETFKAAPKSKDFSWI